MRSRAASLTQTWKQTAIFIWRFKMPTARTPELSAPKFPLAKNGVRFDKWCSAGTKQKFPFTVKSVHDLTIAEHVVTVTGKAFYDIAHAPADHSNRRHSPKDYAVWEIHPVMKLEVVQ